MMWLKAFIWLVAGKHIKICTVKTNVVREKLREIALDIIRCLRCTKIGLRAACPVGMRWNGTILKMNRTIFIIGISKEIIAIGDR